MRRPLLAESELVSVAANPMPPGGRSGIVTTPDGVGLRYAVWRATKRPRNGTVVILQGRSEFIEKYSETISNLIGRDFAVVAFDWRGQGGSQRLLGDPKRGHVSSFSQYLVDLDTIMTEVVLPDGVEPFHCLAHSAGATVAFLYAARARTRFSHIVMSAPLVGLHRPTGKGTRLLVKTLCAIGLGRLYVPGGGRQLVQLIPFEKNVLTSEPLRYERITATIEESPRLGLASPTLAWLNAAFRAFSKIESRRFPDTVRNPILMVEAGKDTVVSNQAIERLAGRLKTGSFVWVSGAKHELLMERDTYREQFWAAFDAFVGLSD